MSDWFSQLKNAKKTCLVENNLKKVHYELGHGKEMVEEYNLDTNVVTRRAWRIANELGAEGKWQIEIGDPEPTYDPKEQLIQENSSQPFISRRNTRTNLEWRIRNLPYPVEVYTVHVDNANRIIEVKTSNKKYYKRINVPELDRLQLPLVQEAVSFSHKFNTLIINYKKPEEMLDFEKRLLQEINAVQPKNYSDPAQCKQN